MTRKKRNNCSIFVIDGEVRHFDNKLGVLKLQVTTEEWEHIVKCTVEYCAYISCLKTVACPMLSEPWEAEDEVYLNELLKTIKQIKALDPFILAKYNYDDTVASLSKIMSERADELVNEIKEFSKLTNQILDNSRTMQVSGL